jgi:hypothetical protein
MAATQNSSKTCRIRLHIDGSVYIRLAHGPYSYVVSTNQAVFIIGERSVTAPGLSADYIPTYIVPRSFRRRCRGCCCVTLFLKV